MQHVWVCVWPKLFKEAHGRAPMYQKLGMSGRCEDHFIIQMSRCGLETSLLDQCVSVVLVWAAGWGKMEDEEMEAWPGLFNLGVCNGQSTLSKEEINHCIECGFPAGLSRGVCVCVDVYECVCRFKWRTRTFSLASGQWKNLWECGSHTSTLIRQAWKLGLCWRKPACDLGPHYQPIKKGGDR